MTQEEHSLEPPPVPTPFVESVFKALFASQQQAHDTDTDASSPLNSPLASPTSTGEDSSAREGLALLTSLLSVENTLISWDDAELKKMFIRRYCERHAANEAELVEHLASAGHLPRTAARSWDTIADLEALIHDARNGARMTFKTPAASLFRKPAATFLVIDQPPSTLTQASSAKAQAADAEAGYDDEPEQQSVTRVVLPPTRVPSPGAVDYSQGGSQKLLRRLRRSRSASRRPEEHERGPDFRDELQRAVDPSSRVASLDFSSRLEFAALSASHKAQAIEMMADAVENASLEEVHLDNLSLDLASAEALATLVRAPKLRVLTLTANRLNEAAVQRLARALRDHPGLRTLAIGDQTGAAISTHAVKELLDSMETVPTLTKLRLGTVHDDAERRRYLSLENAHVSQMRLGEHAQRSAHEAQASDGSAGDGSAGGAPPADSAAGEGTSASPGVGSSKRASTGPPVKDVWGDEARRIAESDDTQLGCPNNEDDSMPWRDPSTTYVLTGCPEWRRATKAERRAVIEAFSTNNKLTSVHMSDSMIDDDLARAWASVLASPTCLVESLTLESNPMSSAGVEAIASAIPSNTSLKELRMRNLHGRVSKEAEEAIAASLEKASGLMKLSMDLKAQHTKDLVRKYLERNEKTRRSERGWGKTSASSKVVGGLWAADWKPDLASGGGLYRTPSKRRDAPLGKHVAVARAKWDGFLEGVKEGAIAEEHGGVLFEPTALPTVELPAEKTGYDLGDATSGGTTPSERRPGAHPFISLGELQKAAKSLGSGMSSLRRRSRTPSSDSEPKPNFAADLASAAVRREAKTLDAVLEIERRRSAITKANALKSHPLADAVVEAAREHGDDILEAVAELERSRTAAEKDSKKKKARSHRLAVMLERTGLLSHRSDVSSRATTARSSISGSPDRRYLPTGAPAEGEAPPSDWKRAIFNAVKHGDEATVQSLLAGNAEHVGCRGSAGVTPLHFAARFGHMAVLEALLEAGADPTARDEAGNTPHDKALAAGFAPIAARLAALQPPEAAVTRSPPKVEFAQHPNAAVERHLDALEA